MAPTTLDTTRNIVLIITPIATFLLALFTINKWKKEHKAKIYFDSSFKFLKSVYTLRDLFMSLRSPFIRAWEMLPSVPENGSNYERENIIHYLNNRQKPFHEALNNFYSVLPEVEILFGKEVVEVCKALNLIIFKYNMAVDEYIQLIGVTNNYEHLADISSQVFSNKTPDELMVEMNEAITEIEVAVSKYLKLKV